MTDDQTRRLIRPAGTVHWVKANDGPHVVSDRWIPQPEQEIQTRPWWRYAIAIFVVFLIAALIIGAAIYAGNTAADGFGPLIPTATPSTTPYPNGWTP